MTQQQVQVPGDDALYIKGQLQDLKSLSIINFIIKGTDNFAITTADDKKFLKKMVKAEQKRGNINIKYLPGRHLAIQKYPGMTKKEIAHEIGLKLKKSGANITKNGTNA